MTNFSTLQTDPASGLPFLIDAATGERVYKHPDCAVCGISRYATRTTLPDCCARCAEARVEEMFE